MLIFNMKMDHSIDISTKEREFKDLVFANNPKLYNKMFVEPEVVPESEVLEYAVPETAGDVADVLAELKGFGIDLEGEPSEEQVAAKSSDAEEPQKSLPSTVLRRLPGMVGSDEEPEPRTE